MTAGDDLLAEVEHVIRKYVVLPNEHAYVAMTLWCAATHAAEAWDIAPRLSFVSPVPGCGKTRALEIGACLCWRPIETFNSTPAALIRSIGFPPPTLFVDEADAIFGTKAGAAGHEDFRAILNAGHKQGSSYRRVKPNLQVEALPAYAMTAIASIKDLPETVMTRSVVIRMRKKSGTESVAPFRQRRDIPALKALGVRLHDWVQKYVDEVGFPDEVPGNPLEDRDADNWECLLAVADAADGEWPYRARQAAKEITAFEQGMQNETRSMQLLRDLAEVWVPITSLTLLTRDLLTALGNLEGAGWDNYFGRALSPRDMANLLRPYEVVPTNVNANGVHGKGYRRDDLMAVWVRYLPEVADSVRANLAAGAEDAPQTEQPRFKVSGRVTG